ncbi:MAG: metallophosphoesterase [Limisphaerales bacterium]
MPGETCTLGILSDIHYAGSAEQARGNDYEYRDLRNPLLRILLRLGRRFIWMRNPLGQNHLLEAFLRQAGPLDFVVANGDYSCDSGFVGLSDDAACQSARECLALLRQRFGQNFRANLGDHELGKLSFFGRRGGMRLASWHRATLELGLPPFWQKPLGNYVLMGLVSSLVALPVFQADMLPEERPEWERLRAEHMAELRRAFAALQPGQRVLLFCHDPSALPFLFREQFVQSRLPQLEHTIVGHLHSQLVLRQSRLLAGMPPLPFLGHTAGRYTAALRNARLWRPFHVRLCPSLAGLELLKDGGFYTVHLDCQGNRPARFHFHRLGR